jgi:hypothetical protein
MTDTKFLMRRVNQLIDEAAVIQKIDQAAAECAYNRIGWLVAPLGGNEWLDQRADEMLDQGLALIDAGDWAAGERAVNRACAWSEASQRLRGVEPEPQFPPDIGPSQGLEAPGQIVCRGFSL